MLSEYRRRMLLAAGRRDLRQILTNWKISLDTFLPTTSRLLKCRHIDRLALRGRAPGCTASFRLSQNAHLPHFVMLVLLGGVAVMLYKLVRYCLA